MHYNILHFQLGIETCILLVFVIFDHWRRNLLTKHNKVWRISMEFLLIKIFRVKLDVSTPTVNVLFMFYCELDNQWFPFIAKGFFQLGRNSIEFSILRCLDTFRIKTISIYHNANCKFYTFKAFGQINKNHKAKWLINKHLIKFNPIVLFLPQGT